MKLKYLIIAIFITLSCVNLTESEETALRKLSEDLETQVQYGKGKSFSTENRSDDNFMEVTITNDSKFSLLPKELTASYAALFMYENLKNEDKINYNSYSINIIDKVTNQNLGNFKFNNQILKNASKCLAIIKETLSKIKANNVNPLFKRLEPEFTENIDSNVVKDWLKENSENIQKIDHYQFVGFYETKNIQSSKKNNDLQMIGILMKGEEEYKKLDVWMNIDEEFVIRNFEIE